MRIDFSAQTKDTLAKRAGFICSSPGCKALTVGPGAAPTQTSSTGVAAHIYSASPDGPRGQGGLGPNELESIENAIWLCELHAKLIDNNQGQAYPPSTLLAWKRLHEARIRSEHCGSAGAFGWMRELIMKHVPVLKTPASIRFGKATLLVGDSGAGKTAMAEWLIGTTVQAPLYRWMQPWNKELEYELVFDDATEHRLIVRASERNGIQYWFDGQAAPFTPVPLAWFRNPERPLRREDDETDVAYLARHLVVDQAVLRNLLAEVGRKAWSTVRRLWVDKVEVEADDEGEPPRVVERIFTDLKGTHTGLPYTALSGSEKDRVLLELMIAAAEVRSQHSPTMLIVELDATSFDKHRVAHYAEALATHEGLFQALFLTTHDRGLEWRNWRTIRLEGRQENVVVKGAGIAGRG